MLKKAANSLNRKIIVLKCKENKIYQTKYFPSNSDIHKILWILQEKSPEHNTKHYIPLFNSNIDKKLKNRKLFEKTALKKLPEILHDFINCNNIFAVSKRFINNYKELFEYSKKHSIIKPEFLKTLNKLEFITNQEICKSEEKGSNLKNLKKTLDFPKKCLHNDKEIININKNQTEIICKKCNCLLNVSEICYLSRLNIELNLSEFLSREPQKDCCLFCGSNANLANIHQSHSICELCWKQYLNGLKEISEKDKSPTKNLKNSLIKCPSRNCKFRILHDSMKFYS